MDENKEKIDLKQESDMARLERNNKRLFELCLIIFLAFCVTNGYWIWKESQYVDSITLTQDVDTHSSPAYVNGTGSMTVNGESKADNH